MLDINTRMLATIHSEEHVFRTVDVSLAQDSLPPWELSVALRAQIDSSLSLKASAVVILTRKVAGVPPGTRGVVKTISSTEVVVGGHAQRVRSVTCDFGGKEVAVGCARVSAFDAAGCEVGYSEQLLLLLGWASTVHRAQGLTLNAVEVDFDLDTWSTRGLACTALFSVRSLTFLKVRGLRRDLIRVSRCALAYYEKKLVQNGIDPADDGRPPVVRVS